MYMYVYMYVYMLNEYWALQEKNPFDFIMRSGWYLHVQCTFG